MLTPTHLITAQTAYLGACLATAHPPVLAEALVATLVGVLPDLDHRQGHVGRLLPPLSGWLEHQVGHRTLTHSLLLFALVGIGAWLWLPPGYALAVLAGLSSHAFADMMTAQGVCWFWPSRVRCVLPGSPRYRVELMGWGELAFAGLMGLLGVGLMLLAGQSEGSAGILRAAIGNISAAREQYDAEKGSHAFRLRVEGRDNRSHASISGDYPVIGPWGDGGFLLRAPAESGAGVKSLCKSASCDWYASHAVLLKAQAQHTTTTTLKRPRWDTASLREALAPWSALGEVYLLGELTSPSIPAQPPNISKTADRLSLQYADPAQLADWPGGPLRDLDLSIQLRHPPGLQPPALNLDQAEPGPSRHPLLQRWIDR
jgi:inner membrane protein